MLEFICLQKHQSVTGTPGTEQGSREKPRKTRPVRNDLIFGCTAIGLYCTDLIPPYVGARHRRARPRMGCR